LKYLKLILYNILLIFLLLLVIEYFLPTISLPINTNRRINLLEHGPNQNKNFKSSVKNETIDFFTDENGFLNENSKSKYIYAIFFGGSTTENILINPQKRFTKHIENKLRKDCECDLTILNGGVSGNNNLNNFLSFIAKGIPLKPRFVFLMGSLNDYYQLNRNLSYWNISDNKSVLTTNQPLLFRFFNFLKNNLFTDIYYHLKSTGITALFNKRNDSVIESNIDFNKKEFMAIINSFNYLSNALDIKFIFMTEPYLDLKYGKLEIGAISNLIDTTDLTFIDLEKMVPKEKKYFLDNTHLSEEGNLLVSEIIFDKIKLINDNNQN